MINKRLKIKNLIFFAFLISVSFLSLFTVVSKADAACVLKAPSVIFSPTNGVIVGANNTKVYKVTIMNNDTSECANSDFDLSIDSQTGDTTYFVSTSLGSAVTNSLSPGQRYDTTLTVNTGAAITFPDAEGKKLTVVVKATDSPVHDGKTGKGSVITKASAFKGDGNLLKRAEEETCHACHKTDRNRTPSDSDWSEAIKTHSSTSLSSTKWGASGWGVAGGKYGEFVCTTCHTSHDTKNIYLIKEAITTPDGSNWGSSGTQNVSVTFKKKATSGNPNPGVSDGVMGDDSVPHGSSSRICEICHTYDAAQTTGVNKHAYNMSAAGTHENGNDCTTCHDHKKSFSKGGCTGCHGNPPVAASIGGPSGLATPATGATSPLSPGAHNVHVTTRSMICNACHTGNTMPTVSNSIQMGFVTNSTNYPGWGSTAVTTGSFDGHTPLNASYTFESSNVGTTVTTSASYANTCSSLYCHGSTLTAGTLINPSWVGGSSQAGCGTCHGGAGYTVAATTPPTTGKHTTHASTTTGNLGLACNKCHNSTSNMEHVNGTVSWALDSSDSRIGSATYKSSQSGSTTELAPSATYGNCENLYCHSNGKVGTTVEAYVNRAWDGAAIGCNGCHGTSNTAGTPDYANAGAGTVAANSHQKHTKAGTSTCVYCHNSTTVTGTTISSGSTKHTDGTRDVENGGGKSFSWAPQTCSSISCHGSGSGSAQWGATLNCSSCHAFPPATNAHAAHIQNSALLTVAYGNTEVVSNAANYAFGCGNCHPKAVSYHANGTTDIILNDGVVGDTLKVKNDAGANSAGTGGSTVCNGTYCHSNGAGGAALAFAASPAWSATLSGDKCGSCHDNPPQYDSVGSGVAGANSHYSDSVPGFMGKEGGHMITIHRDNMYNKVSGSGLIGLDDAASADSRHGNPNVATTMACYVCHSGIISSTTIDTYAMYGTASSFRCGACHTAVTTTKLQAGVISDKSLHVNGSPNVVFAAITMRSKAQLRDASKPATWTRNGTYGVSGSYDSSTATLDGSTWNSGTRTCTTACHNGGSATWGDTTVTCYSCHTSL